MLLMKPYTLCWRKLSRARLRIVFIDVAQGLQNIAALLGKVRSYFHKLAPSMREAVRQQDLGAVAEFRRVARQSITHLNGRAKLFRAMPQYIAQIFPQVLAPGEVQSDLLPLLGRHDAGGEHTGAFVRWLSRQMQYAHAGIVVVYYFALSRLPDQFVQCRLDHFGGFFHDLPLRGSRQ